jgi:hypothetical protein
MAKPQYANRRHTGLRATLAVVVASGRGVCREVVCLEERDGRGRRIAPGTPWDLAHDRTRPGAYLGEAHRRCNRSEGARYGNGFKRRLRRRVL